MFVKEIMKKDVVTCEPDSDLNEVITLMREHDCGFIPVVGARGDIAGVVTDRDACLTAASRHRQPGRVSARETMSHPVFSCFADDDVRVALTTMASHHVRRLPVMTRDGHLEGVLSVDDIVQVADRQGAPASADVVSALRIISARQPIRPAHA